MSRFGNPSSLGEVLERLIDRMDFRDRLDEAAVVDAWRELAGPDICAVMGEAWVQGRKLFVRVTSAASRQDMHLDRSKWRDRLNERLGASRIEEIVFR